MDESTVTRRSLLRGTVGAAAGLALAACLPGSPPGPAAQPSPAVRPKRGGVLVVADRSDPGTLDPVRTTTLSTRRIGFALFEPLADVDPRTGEMVPVLAERIEATDATTHMLHLRQGVKFHDGTPFDAQAVQLHFERYADPKRSRRVGDVADIAGTDVINSSTVRVRLKRPIGWFPALLYGNVGMISSPAAVQRYGEDYGTKAVVGTGPFKFVSYAASTEVVLERNPDYWSKDLPYLDGVRFKTIPVVANRAIEVRSGTAHVGEDMPLADVERLRAMQEIVLSEAQGNRFHFYRWSRTSPYGQSHEFRQSLNWILDRPLLQKSVWFGTGQPAFDPFLPGTPFHDPAYKPFTFDLERARELVNKANVPKPMRFTLYQDGETTADAVAQIVQANYAKIGVEINMQVEDAVALRARASKGDFHLLMSSDASWFGWQPDAALALARNFRSVPTGGSSWGPVLTDPRIDDLIDQGSSGSDTQKRRASYRDLVRVMNDLAFYPFSMYGSDFKALSRKVKGFVHYQDGLERYKAMWLDE